MGGPYTTEEKAEVLSNAFNYCDTDKSGSAEVKEIKVMMSKCFKNENTVDAYVEKFFKLLDDNHDRKISKEEWMKMLNHPELTNLDIQALLTILEQGLARDV